MKGGDWEKQWSAGQPYWYGNYPGSPPGTTKISTWVNPDEDNWDAKHAAVEERADREEAEEQAADESVTHFYRMPDGWVQRYDDDSNNEYFLNEATGETRWPWEEEKLNASGGTYLYDPRTGKSRVPEVAGPTSGSGSGRSSRSSSLHGQGGERRSTTEPIRETMVKEAVVSLAESSLRGDTYAHANEILESSEWEHLTEAELSAAADRTRLLFWPDMDPDQWNISNICHVSVVEKLTPIDPPDFQPALAQVVGLSDKDKQDIIAKAKHKQKELFHVKIHANPGTVYGQDRQDAHLWVRWSEVIEYHVLLLRVMINTMGREVHPEVDRARVAATSALNAAKLRTGVSSEEKLSKMREWWVAALNCVVVVLKGGVRPQSHLWNMSPEYNTALETWQHEVGAVPPADRSTRAQWAITDIDWAESEPRVSLGDLVTVIEGIDKKRNDGDSTTKHSLEFRQEADTAWDWAVSKLGHRDYRPGAAGHQILIIGTRPHSQLNIRQLTNAEIQVNDERETLQRNMRKMDEQRRQIKFTRDEFNSHEYSSYDSQAILNRLFDGVHETTLREIEKAGLKVPHRVDGRAPAAPEKPNRKAV